MVFGQLEITRIFSPDSPAVPGEREREMRRATPSG
jgi:hypothetical protein